MDVRETVHLGVLQKNIGCIFGQSGTQSQDLHEARRPGVRTRFIVPRWEKAMLAFQPEETIEKIVSSIRFTRYTPKTICSREKLVRASRDRSAARICRLMTRRLNSVFVVSVAPMFQCGSVGHCSRKRLGTHFAHHRTKCSRAIGATCADLLPRNLGLTGYARNEEEKIPCSVAFPDALRRLSHLRFFHLDHDRAEDYSGSKNQPMRWCLPAREWMSPLTIVCGVPF